MAVDISIRIAANKATGGRMFILNDRAELRHPITKDWVRAVVYTDNVNIYCRIKEDFDEHYTLISTYD